MDRMIRRSSFWPFVGVNRREAKCAAVGCITGESQYTGCGKYVGTKSVCQPLEIRQLEVPVFCGLFHNIILQRLPVFCEPGFRRACRSDLKRGSKRGRS